MDVTLLHELPLAWAEREPAQTALTYGGRSLTYGELAQRVSAFASGVVGAGLRRGERCGIYLEKCF